MRAIAVRCFSARPARPAAGRKFPRTFVSCIGASPAAMARCRILKRDFSMTLTVDREWPARILLAVGQLAANGAPSPRNARVGFHDDLVYCSATHSAVLSDKAVKVGLPDKCPRDLFRTQVIESHPVPPLWQPLRALNYSSAHRTPHRRTVAACAAHVAFLNRGEP